MTADDDRDPMLRRLRELEVLRPDQQRAARLRARCHARLRRPAPPAPRLGTLLFAGACVVYVGALVLDVVVWPGAR